MPNKEPRKSQLNADIEEKLLFLAKIAARHKGQSLVEFIEDAFTRALSAAAMSEDESTYGAEFNTKQPSPLWMEGMWVDTGKPEHDAAVRLYLVATADLKLLAPKQRAFFHHTVTELIKQGKKPSLKNFVESIDFSGSGE